MRFLIYRSALTMDQDVIEGSARVLNGFQELCLRLKSNSGHLGISSCPFAGSRESQISWRFS